ncbi:MAG: pyridoxal phosphate-dependent aminotransferase, partial [Euryarchaeota archaeon]|nr:pyridoxal phosphate-dependent aminotransferase [Euryarchaeota archaeon]
MEFREADRLEKISVSGIRKMFELVQAKDVINLGLGEPDFTPPEHVLEAAKKALDEGFTHYTSNFGILELREAIAQKLKQENKLDVKPDQIIVTCGGSEALFVAVQATVNPNEEVLIPDPGFVSYGPIVKMAGAIPVSVPVFEKNDFRLKPEEIEKRITKRTKMMIINSPANPTGSVLTKSDLKAIAEIAERKNILILSDEVYEKLVYEGEHFSIGSISDKVITVNSFSKTYAMTGFRIGYLAAHQDLIEPLLKVHQYLTACANSIAQKAALAALTGPQDFVKNMFKEFKMRRDLIVGGLNEINGFSCKKPKGAFYAFSNISKLGKPSNEIAMSLLEKVKVVSTAGSAFGENGEGYLRFTYATKKE